LSTRTAISYFGLLHGLDDLLAASARLSAEDDRQAGLCQDLLAELDVGAFEAHDQRHVEVDLRAAAMTPSAITSQRMMPPKMLTRMPFTLGRRG
jgi:hypothetical protein